MISINMNVNVNNAKIDHQLLCSISLPLQTEKANLPSKGSDKLHSITNRMRDKHLTTRLSACGSGSCGHLSNLFVSYV